MKISRMFRSIYITLYKYARDGYKKYGILYIILYGLIFIPTSLIVMMMYFVLIVCAIVPLGIILAVYRVLETCLALFSEILVILLSFIVKKEKLFSQFNKRRILLCFNKDEFLTKIIFKIREKI